jgi:hypothetical protein
MKTKATGPTYVPNGILSEHELLLRNLISICRSAKISPFLALSPLTLVGTLWLFPQRYGLQATLAIFAVHRIMNILKHLRIVIMGVTFWFGDDSTSPGRASPVGTNASSTELIVMFSFFKIGAMDRVIPTIYQDHQHS